MKSDPLSTTSARPPAKRPSSAARGYGRRWRKARAEFLKNHALCEHCLREGRETPATCIDHASGHDEKRSGFWDTSKWVASCRSCNSRFGASHEGAFGNPRRPRPELHHLPPVLNKFRETFWWDIASAGPARSRRGQTC
jgi:5-methylcytosine-specific restriction endonuclease McrA